MIRQLLRTNPHSWAPLPIRIALGVIFFLHGSQKLFGWFGGHGLTATGGFFEQAGITPGPLWALLAGAAEFLGGLSILLGGFTRLGGLAIAVVMAVAMIKVHWGSFFLPEGVEYTFALLGAALAIMISGGGALSFDALFTVRMGEWEEAPLRMEARREETLRT